MVISWADVNNRKIRHTEKAISGFADPAAYLCLVQEFSSRVDGHHLFGKILYVDRKATGFSLAARTGSTSAALYASLSVGGAAARPNIC